MTLTYPQLFQAFERQRWSLNDDIPWDQFDSSCIDHSTLHSIKMNAILEWAAMPTVAMFLRDFADDTDFCAFTSIWFYEEQKHSLVLMEYLRRFAPSYVPRAEELSNVNFSFDAKGPADTLAFHFFGEIRLHYWYRCAAIQTREPVLKEIYAMIATDEARHAAAYGRYLKNMISKDPKVTESLTKVASYMTNPKLRHGLHPTNVHVAEAHFPNDTVTSRLPDPEWLSRWLDGIIGFDDSWEHRVEQAVLKNLSGILGVQIESLSALSAYRKSLRRREYQTESESSQKGGLH